FPFPARHKIHDVMEAITGSRTLPACSRIGGVAHALPRGWDRLLPQSLDRIPHPLDSSEKAAPRNTILQGRSQ
ncbi:NADH-quinone oxidoreductase subunit C/D, partial [Salmonella enterica]